MLSHKAIHKILINEALLAPGNKNEAKRTQKHELEENV